MRCARDVERALRHRPERSWVRVSVSARVPAAAARVVRGGVRALTTATAAAWADAGPAEMQR